jgi:lantibiotic modifying enzyme
MGFVALAEATSSEVHLERARDCGDQLLAAQRVVSSGGAAWPNRAGLAQPGWAHGAAGIARALAALGVAVGDARYQVAAAAAVGYERSLFNSERRNWPTLLVDAAGGRRRSSWRIAYCRGAPGVALSRLLMPATMRDDMLSAESELALDTTAEGPRDGLDHLCCGIFGRSSVLLSAACLTGAEKRLEQARLLADESLNKAPTAGGFRFSFDCYENRRLHPGLIDGVAGIAYQLLRLAGATDLPDVLALELDVERRDRLGK